MQLLDQLWKKYPHAEMDMFVFPEEILSQGKRITYKSREIIVSRGDYPQYLYFIISGVTIGSREYEDGNAYDYFQLDTKNGSIGLLEILAQKSQYIATVMSISEVEILRIDSAIIYTYIMENPEMLRRCVTHVSRDLYAASGNNGILYYLNGVNRLRYYLVSYYDSHKSSGKKVIVQEGYQDIARQIGSSIRTVGRGIHTLKENQEIISINKKIVLTEKEREILSNNLWS